MSLGANLHIDVEVIDTFSQAQELRNIRMLTVKIDGEKLVLANTGNFVSSAKRDFQNMADKLEDNVAAFILFCLEDKENLMKSTSIPLNWLLITWIPDMCSVRHKMLYSSSQRELKMALGSSLISKEYAASTRDDLTWESYQRSFRPDGTDIDVFTEEEKLLHEEKSHQERGATSLAGMGSISFKVGQEVTDALIGLKQIGGDNWIEIEVQTPPSVEVETITFVSSTQLSQFTSFTSMVNKEVPRFYLSKLPKVESTETTSVCILSVPESAPVRMKMTMATVKSSLVARAKEHGIVFDKMVEIRDPEDIDHALGEILQGPVVAAPQSVLTNVQQHAKPTGPGRRPGTNRGPKKFTAT